MSEPTAFEIPIGTDYRGTHGLLQFIPYFDPRPEHKAQICAYLINAPSYHPDWSQYVLAVTSLAPMKDTEPPLLKFEGATHELMCATLQPRYSQTVESILENMRKGVPPPALTPINVAEQFKATDDEMLKLTWLLGRAVVRGKLDPEATNGADQVRAKWYHTAHDILNSLRGETSNV
jgi:hypothetical protein